MPFGILLGGNLSSHHEIHPEFHVIYGVKKLIWGFSGFSAGLQKMDQKSRGAASDLPGLLEGGFWCTNLKGNFGTCQPLFFFGIRMLNFSYQTRHGNEMTENLRAGASKI